MSLVVEHGQFAGSPERSVNVRSSDAGKTLEAVDKLPPVLQPFKCSLQNFTDPIEATADNAFALNLLNSLNDLKLLELPQQPHHSAGDAKLTG
jgi:hypothetical protein